MTDGTLRSGLGKKHVADAALEHFYYLIIFVPQLCSYTMRFSVSSEPARTLKSQSSLIGKGRKIESGVGRIHEVDEIATGVCGHISVFGVPNGAHPARERS
jgi:hypothetical protein